MNLEEEIRGFEIRSKMPNEKFKTYPADVDETPEHTKDAAPKDEEVGPFAFNDRVDFVLWPSGVGVVPRKILHC